MKKLIEAIHQRAVEVADRLSKNSVVEVPIDTRTDREKMIDRFFSNPRFGCNQDAVVDLIDAVTGRRPQAPVKPKPLGEVEKFQVVHCTQHDKSWLVLDKKDVAWHGFAPSRDDTIYHVDAGCERLATQEETAACLEAFKNYDGAKFFNWCIKNSIQLPEDLLASL